MRLRTLLIVSLQNILSRNNGFKLKVNNVKALTINHGLPILLTTRIWRLQEGSAKQA
jgi:hypothetical protein